MKKPILLLTFLFLTIIVIVVILRDKLLSSSSKQFTLYNEEGEVFYKTDEQSEYLELPDEKISLSSGTYIKTQAGFAHVIFADNSMMSIDQYTEVQIDISLENTTILQKSGNTWHRIKEVVENKEYNVETSNTLATVRGTKLGVLVDKNTANTDVFVTENAVEIFEVISIDGKKQYEGKQELLAGKIMILRDGDRIITDTPDEILGTYWYKRNQILDKDFDKMNIEKIINNLKTKEELNDFRIHKVQQTTSNLLNKLQAIRDTDETPTTDEIDTFLKYLETTYSVNITGEQACSQLENSQYEDDLEKLETYKETIGAEYEQLISYLSDLKKYCATDGLSKTEIADLENHYTFEYLQIDKNLAEFDSKIKASIHYYTVVEGDGTILCTHLSTTSLDEILAKFTSIEDEYKVTRKAADEFQAALTYLYSACSNGTISAAETEHLNTLLSDSKN